jgi:phage repressor protein C with HTH and peptisase S24 domain
MEPTLRRDDLVMIDASQNHIGMQDQIWALAYAGTGMIKRVRRRTGGRIEILSDNPSVPPLDVDEEEVYVVGKVVWTARVM